jgi:hypothetical protein
MISIDRRIARLLAHRDRFLTNRYPPLEAAEGTKWYSE